jgi:hypothetical protein
MRKVKRAVMTAKIDAWSVGVFGGLTALFGLTDLPSLALGVIMLGVAFVERRASDKLKRLDVNATETLAWNQLALGGSLMIYAILRLYAVTHGPSEYAEIMAKEPELKQMLGSVEDLTQMILLTVYLCLIAVAIFAQGGMALYYFTRGRALKDYLATTPGWIQEMQRAGVSV